MSTSVPSTIDELFDSTGTKALKIMIVLTILLTSIAGVVVVTGGETGWIASGLSRVIGVGWLFTGLQDLGTAINRASESLKSYNVVFLVVEIGAIIRAVFTVAIGVLRVVMVGYVDLAMFIVGAVPSIVKPLGIFIATGLTFVQFCVVWVVAKYFVNMVYRLISMISGSGSPL